MPFCVILWSSLSKHALWIPAFFKNYIIYKNESYRPLSTSFFFFFLCSAREPIVCLHFGPILCILFSHTTWLHVFHYSHKFPLCSYCQLQPLRPSKRSIYCLFDMSESSQSRHYGLISETSLWSHPRVLNWAFTSILSNENCVVTLLKVYKIQMKHSFWGKSRQRVRHHVTEIRRFFLRY